MFIGSLIIAIFCLLSVGYTFAVSPAETTVPKTKEKEGPVSKSDSVVLPKIEYKAEGLRDPFESFFKKEPVAPSGIITEEQVSAPQAPVLPPSLTVQGIIWGGKIPQAIINDKVVKIGDVIAESKIIDISKETVKILFQNHSFNLTSPAASQLQSLKTNPEGGQDEK
jgi:hypothetical protein